MKKYCWLMLVFLSACAWDDLSQEASAYPEDIAAIIVPRCANAGCHTTQSAAATAGLNLESWNSLFLGSRGGSAVVPYAPDQSYLLYAVNTDTSNGEPVLNPTMPIGGTPLSADEYAGVKQWILDGARNRKGEERFPQRADRSKWYVANQGCDLVAVIDAESHQIMRYVQVGNNPASSESPHSIRVSNDGRYWYVVFLLNNPHLEIYSTLTDAKVGDIPIGTGAWNTFALSADERFGIAVAYQDPGVTTFQAVIVDLIHGVVTEPMNFGPKVHGSIAHPTLRRFYVTEQDLSALIAIDYDSLGHVTNTDPIDLEQGVPAHNGEAHLDPHEVIFSPDATTYFVSCEEANEVRAYDGVTNALLAVIQTGAEPEEMAIAPSAGLLFVTCLDDETTFANEAGRVGSVAIIDIQTLSFVKAVYSGYQPHGLAVDATNSIVIVANRNVNALGPAPHHTSSCGGRNGYLTAIDIQTLELRTDFKAELSSDPYAVAVKE